MVYRSDGSLVAPTGGNWYFYFYFYTVAKIPQTALFVFAKELAAP